MKKRRGCLRLKELEGDTWSVSRPAEIRGKRKSEVRIWVQNLLESCIHFVSFQKLLLCIYYIIYKVLSKGIFRNKSYNVLLSRGSQRSKHIFIMQWDEQVRPSYAWWIRKIQRMGEATCVHPSTRVGFLAFHCPPVTTMYTAMVGSQDWPCVCRVRCIRNYRNFSKVGSVLRVDNKVSSITNKIFWAIMTWTTGF